MARLGYAWDELKSGFWFLPALLLLGGVLLFAITLTLDKSLPAPTFGLPLLFSSGGADAARTLLSVISGSLIAVVATIFSLTIVALQLASANYSPRVLRNFTSDRGIQAVLGFFIGTFLYALLVLRVIRTTEGTTPAFVPPISMATAMVLALVCMGWLIYFVHHISSIIQSSSIVLSAREDAVGSIEQLNDLEDDPEEPELPEGLPDDELPEGETLVLRAKKSGYMQYVDFDGLLEAVAKSAKTKFVEVPYGPGFYVVEGLPVVRIWPAPEGGLDSDSEYKAHDALYLGKERSFRQDFAFGLRQLADIALKGVSPGVNDPTTSMQAMDQMEVILSALSKKAMPPRLQKHYVGGESMIVKFGHYGYDDVVGLAFDQLRRASFTSGQVAVLERLLEVIGRLIQINRPAERRMSLWKRAFAVGRLAPQQVSDPQDAVALVCRTVEAGASLLRTELGAAVGSDMEKLADLSEEIEGGERVREAVEAAWGSSG